MTLLNQIVAVETGIKSKTTRVVTDLHRLSQNETLLNGRIKTYRPKDEDGDRYPPDNQPVQLRHSDALVTLAAELTKLFDVVLTKDVGNAGATASVSVPGRPTPLLADVPVTYLLFLEKQLTDLRTFVDKLQVQGFAVQRALADLERDRSVDQIFLTRERISFVAIALVIAFLTRMPWVIAATIVALGGFLLYRWHARFQSTDAVLAALRRFRLPARTFLRATV